MKKLTILISLAFTFLAAGAQAQALAVKSVGSGIYCRFSPDCKPTPTEQTDSMPITNAPATCVLVSRSYAGNTQDSAGKYGYEYMFTLNSDGSNASGSNIVSVSALTLNIANPQPFAFGQHASNYVWALTSDGPVGLAPASADSDGKKVTIHFDPPLALNTATDQSTNTCYFGMISVGVPEVTSALVSGSADDSTNGAASFKVKLQAQTP